MIFRRRRLIVRSLAVVVLGALSFGGWLLHDTLVVGVGYKAKMLCSGVFVSRLDPEAVLTDLHAEDLGALRHIDASIDRGAEAVTASFLGTVRRRAVYRNGLGCTLVLDGLIPPALPDNQSTREPAAAVAPLRRAVEQRTQDGVGDASLGNVQAAVNRAFAEPDPQHLRRTLAVVVVHRGQIVAEQYAPGISPDTPLAGWSMTKSVMNALIGILVRDGVLALGLPVPVPEWQHAGDPRAAITLDQLLRMSSGLRFDEGMVSPSSDVMQMLFGAGDVAAFAVNKELASAPGTTWEYASGTSNILARIIRKVLRDQSAYLTFPRRALFDRIGMLSATLETDAAGTFVGSSYMYATARDWARFGILYLQDGVWNGERILPEGWVAYTTSPAPADDQGRYGAHFWLRVPDDYAGTDAHLPVQAFHAAGHEAQFVTIVPSHELVIVRLGRTRYPQAWDHPAFVRDVVESKAGFRHK
ncbi:MAG: serine hydrolase [Methylomonas sp.]|nr:serine hydrolase [Methylomonas sp.]PPD20888.1 MAG: serine hydrolase [Methylomonas sp.]PPD25611.1 MAG: serine hydrolase [Methylomonas sp.]PPD36612.1 MAG: serine hydrolase [Methylomonas sp.]PPD39919.1 MAG: serine hydrolase [Methylomonas sp.]